MLALTLAATPGCAACESASSTVGIKSLSLAPASSNACAASSAISPPLALGLIPAKIFSG